MSDKVMQGAEPWSAKGGRRGALVLHGFTGCPQSMRPLGHAFADAGYTVEVPRLPGHGTSLEDMAQYRWSDWSAAAETAYQDLAARCDDVVVIGLSMGGTLTLWLAQNHPEIKGIVLVNPAVNPDDFAPFATGAQAVLDAGDMFLPGVGGDVADPESTELAYDGAPATSLLSMVDALVALRPGLSRITMPVLLYHSLNDHVVPPGSAALLKSDLGGPVDYIPLNRSFHVATIDYDRDVINQGAVGFAGTL